MKNKILSQTNNSILFVLLLSIYPLFLGGNRPFPIYLFGMAFSLTAMVAIYHSHFGFWASKNIKIIMMWVVGLISFLLASALFIAPHPYFPFVKWIQYLGYGLIFMQAMIFAQVSRFFYKLVNYTFIAGVVYALYGIIMLSLGDMILFYEKTSYKGTLTSVFINRNHMALYLNITFLCGLYNLVSNIRRKPIFISKRPIVILVEFLNYVFSDGLWRILGLSVIIMALFLTSSRGGVIQLLASILLVGSIFHWRQDGGFSKRIIILNAVTLFIVALVLSSGLSSSLNSRMHYLGSSLVERQAVWDTTKEIISDNLVLGAGLGQFETTFNHYRDNDLTLNKIWDKAHNDYYEVLAEFGIIYALFLWGGIAYILYRCYLRLGRGDGRRMALILSIFFVAALHSFYDFGLQMPALASLWISFLGYGYSRAVQVS